MTWLWLDLVARARSRTTWVALAMLAYAVVGLPFLMAEPPPHIEAALGAWFGTAEPFLLFLYLWTDVAMNKVFGLVAVVLAGQTLVQERDTHTLDVLRSKPITLPALFLVRAGSAIGLAWGLYAAAALVGLPWFMARVEGFRPGVFLASTAVHAGAVAFAVALSATIAVVIGRRTQALVVSLLVVFTLMGGAFAGFYNPAWATIALLNPFAMGVQVVGHAGDLTAARVLGPLAGTWAATAAMLAVGAAAARRWEEAS
jgi:ABC-2 type transport system permease protein